MDDRRGNANLSVTRGWLLSLRPPRPHYSPLRASRCGGCPTRDFTFVEDAADAFLLAILKLPLSGQHFLVGSPFEASMRQVADLVVAACGRGTVVERPYPPGVREIEVSRYLTSSAKFRGATGWEPRVPFKEGIERTVAFYRERLPLYT